MVGKTKEFLVSQRFCLTIYFKTGGWGGLSNLKLRGDFEKPPCTPPVINRYLFLQLIQIWKSITLQDYKKIDTNGAITELMAEFQSVGLNWQSLHSVKECLCSSPFEPFGAKLHCYTCGHLFCVRCIDKRIALPGHASKQAVPVCRHCYRNVMRSNSIDCI